jgi:hypothetical protein
MKLISFKTLVLASSAFCATAAFAANQARVEVPFAFTAKGQSFPAGSYKVALDEHRNFVTMASQSQPGKQISWSVGPTDERKAPATVVFDETGSDYALKSIQVGSKVTPNLDKPTPTKRGIGATISIAGQ